MFKSNFSISGLDIGKTSHNMTYLYGMSDFWTTIFEDSSQVDILLQATTFQLSEIYSRFLQLTSTISLSDIQATVNSQLKLLIISESGRTSDPGYTYSLSESIMGGTYIANRPFLPTLTLEQGVHFNFAPDGSTVSFYTDPATLPFPSRKLSDGTVEYSLWVSDAEIDEGLISSYYGNLINVTPEASSENFRQYIQGLYYVYTQGPILETLRRGLNLVLGIPLSRANEQVIAITKYLQTNNWMVITETNSYVIPYGLVPTVLVGDYLTVGQELAQWVEIKDYEEDGKWWINYSLPLQLIPSLPPGEVSRFATDGSYADYLMQNFLKTHTFLVNIRVADFQNVQIFSNLSEIINKVKPAYTFPVYVWTIEEANEELYLEEQSATIELDFHGTELLTEELQIFQRNQPNTPHYRGSPAFLRYNAPDLLDYWTGRDSQYQGFSSTIESGGVTYPLEGYIGTQAPKFYTSGVSEFGLGYGNIPQGLYYFQGVMRMQAGQTSVTREMGPYDLSVVGTVLSSSINWASPSTPPLIEVSLDGGTTWATISSPGPIPGLSSGTSCIGYSLIFRQIFTSANSSALSDFSFTVTPTYGFLETSNNYGPWMRTLYSRGRSVSISNRKKVVPLRGLPQTGEGETAELPSRPPVGYYSSFAPNTHPINNSDGGYPNYSKSQLIPLYLTKQWDLLNKMVSLGLPPKPLDEFFIRDINPKVDYDLLFTRGSTVNYLGAEVPIITGYQTYQPTPSEIGKEDYLYVARVIDDLFAVYWVKIGSSSLAPPYWSYRGSDKMSYTINSPLNRLGPYSGFQAYSVRGVNLATTNTNNTTGVNEGVVGANTVNPQQSVTYYDSDNPGGVTLNRNGSLVTFRKEL